MIYKYRSWQIWFHVWNTHTKIQWSLKSVRIRGLRMQNWFCGGSHLSPSRYLEMVLPILWLIEGQATFWLRKQTLAYPKRSSAISIFPFMVQLPLAYPQSFTAQLTAPAGHNGASGFETVQSQSRPGGYWGCYFCVMTKKSIAKW